jgi:hypothetical protein
MRILVIGSIALGAVAASVPPAQSQSGATVANEADDHRAMKELSNWDDGEMTTNSARPT